MVCGRFHSVQEISRLPQCINGRLYLNRRQSEGDMHSCCGRTHDNICAKIQLTLTCNHGWPAPARYPSICNLYILTYTFMGYIEKIGTAHILLCTLIPEDMLSLYTFSDWLVLMYNARDKVLPVTLVNNGPCF